MITPLEGRKNRIRRELSFPADGNRNDQVEMLDIPIVKMIKTTNEQTSKKKTRKKSITMERDSTKIKGKRKEKNELESRKEPETWVTVLGRRERKNSAEKRRDSANNIKRKEINKEIVKKKKPLKTSAVVITAGEDVSYSEVLAWARQGVKLNEEKMASLSTKRSATGRILLEIRGENNVSIAEKLISSLKFLEILLETLKILEYIDLVKWLL